MEFSPPPQPKAERNTTRATTQNGKEEEREMDSVSRIKESRLMIRISYAGEEKESIEEEKAAQVHKYIEIHYSFKPDAFP